MLALGQHRMWFCGMETQELVFWCQCQIYMETRRVLHTSIDPRPFPSQMKNEEIRGTKMKGPDKTVVKSGKGWYACVYLFFLFHYPIYV